MDILDLLANDNYIVYNKALAKEIGSENAMVFGALCGYQKGFKNQEFYREQDKIIEDTCLTEYAVRKSIKELQELNLIGVTKKGLPAKYYYKINKDSFLKLLDTSGNDIESTSGAEIDTTGHTENDTTIKTINKNEDKNNNIYMEIVGYLNQKLNKKYRPTNKETQRHINARLREGYTLDDFKKVIDNKCADWVGTKFATYLTPDTLFAQKFDKYLNATIIKDKDTKRMANTHDYTKQELNDVYASLKDMEL